MNDALCALGPRWVVNEDGQTDLNSVLQPGEGWSCVCWNSFCKGVQKHGSGGGALQHVVPSSAGALTMVSKESPGRMATLGVFSTQPPHSVLLFPLWGP